MTTPPPSRALLLPPRYASRALTRVGLVALLQRRNEAMGVRPLRRILSPTLIYVQM